MYLSPCIEVESGNVWTPLYIKVDCWHSIELAQGILDGSHQNLPDGRIVLELYFRFGGMYIDVNICGVNLEVKEVGNLLAFWDKMCKCLHNSLMEVRVTHVSAIHEEKLIGVFLTGSLWLANKTRDAGQGRIHIDSQ